jgi:hypothetical protein
MALFFGNMISLRNSISDRTISVAGNETTSLIRADVSGGRGNYTYAWVQSGTTCTITNPNNFSTRFIGSGVEGTTTVYCETHDLKTGNMLISGICNITWLAVSQNIVISGSRTYIPLTAQSYTLTGTPATPVPSGTPSSFTNAGTYIYSRDITSITPGSGYTLGTVIGSFIINPATLTAATTSGSATFNGENQTVAVINVINGTYSGSASVTGKDAGNYSTTIYGIGNYTGNITGILTVSPATITLQGTGESKTYDGTTQYIPCIVGGTARSDYNYTISGNSGVNVGTYTATITTTYLNYVVSPTLNSFTWKITTPLTASITTGSATYNGFSQLVTVISGINGTYSGSESVSGKDVGLHSTTITGTGNYTGSVTGILTITRPLTASTTSVNVTYNRSYQSFTISEITGTYSGNRSVSGIDAGSYTTIIYGTGYYTGYVIGTLNIYQDSGYVDIFYGGVHDASRTSNIFVPVRVSNAAFTVTHSVSGPGYADAHHTSFGLDGPHAWNMLYDPVPPGAVIRNTNPYTQGFVVSITASITDANYTFMSATTSVTVNAYYNSGDGGFISE